jgi:LSD1 subclass zinc finger protein
MNASEHKTASTTATAKGDAELGSLELNRQKTFPCTSCGAKLAFKPGSDRLGCPYCGTTNVIPESSDTIEELDFEQFLEDIERHAETVTQSAVKCTNCGAEQTLPPAISIGSCTFCHAPLVSKSYALRLIKPKAVAPFAIDRGQAQETFRKWIGSLWLAPGKLKTYAKSDDGLRGIYIPYWTYDCSSATDYQGRRGDNYYDEEVVWVKDSNGQDVQQRRQVQKINWTPAAGHVQLRHDDVVVLASRSFPPELKAPLSGWRLTELKPYQAEYVAGFQVEGYALGLKDGFVAAQPAINAEIASAIRRDIGGDHQQILTTRVAHSDVTFKHVLLPLWVSSYVYKGRTFRFMINGQTGQVTGEWPKSPWKILGLVALALVVIGILFSLGGK